LRVTETTPGRWRSFGTSVCGTCTEKPLMIESRLPIVPPRSFVWASTRSSAPGVARTITDVTGPDVPVEPRPAPVATAEMTVRATTATVARSARPRLGPPVGNVWCSDIDIGCSLPRLGRAAFATEEPIRPPIERSR
jgi:hypothetical protein